MAAKKVVYCVIPVRNRLAHTVECCKGIIGQDYPEVRAIFIDDGSTDGTSEYLVNTSKSHKSIEVILGSGELWWGGAMKKGIDWVLERAREDDYLLMLNDDIKFSRTFVSSLVEESHQHGKAVVGARQINEQGKLLGSGFLIDYVRTSFQPVIPAENAIEVHALPGRGTLFPMEAVSSIGNINARMFRHYLADLEYSARAREAGWLLLISARAYLSTGTERSDYEVVEDGVISRKLKFKSKDNLLHKLLFFSCRGPLYLRLFAPLRYGFFCFIRLVD